MCDRVFFDSAVYQLELVFLRLAKMLASSVLAEEFKVSLNISLTELQL